MITESLFNPNLDRVVTRECHPDLRGTDVLDFALALIGPLKGINNDFKEQREANLKNLRFIRSTCQFVKLLNDLFDASARRIEIVNKLNPSDESIIYGVESLQPSALIYGLDDNPAWQMTIDNVDADTDLVNFIVQIPAAINTELIKDQITEIIEKYKLLTTTWTFEII